MHFVGTAKNRYKKPKFVISEGSSPEENSKAFNDYPLIRGEAYQGVGNQKPSLIKKGM